MSNNVIQTSFAAGELSPSLYAHVDLDKYHTGVALAKNYIVDYRGGLSTRAGTAFVGQTYISSAAVTLVPFQYSTLQTFMLEFGAKYMRVILNGAPVLEGALNITAISQANPGIITVPMHGLTSGQSVVISGVAGMTQLNQITATVVVVTINTFYLIDLFGNAINTTSYTPYASGGTVSRVYTAVSPYAAADLALLKYTQNANVMTLTHPSYPPYELTRVSNTNWTFTQVTFAANLAAPTGLAANFSAPGTASYVYAVTAVGADGTESVASARYTLTGAVDITATAGSIAIAWNAVPGAVKYNVYKYGPADGGATIPAGINLGYMSNTTNTSTLDTNIIPNFTLSPPQGTNPFASNNNPSTVGYFSQRIVYAASTTMPETFWMSQPGLYHTFDVSDPVRPDDAITDTLVSTQVNKVKYMIAMPGGLIMFTSGGAWQVSGANGVISPTTIQATPQAYNGCADVLPLPINYNILYVQNKGTIVRDLSYNFYTNIYTGEDISVLSNHLFQGYSIVNWTYAEEPFKVVWVVRSDGRFLSLTYLKEQKVQGWAQHSTQGLVKSIASIQEGQENAVYMVVQRYVRGQWLQYIERMASRFYTFGVEDAWCVDAGLQTVPTSYPAATLTPTAVTGTAQFNTDISVFSAANVGQVIRVGGGVALITAYNNPNSVTGTFTRDMTVMIPTTNLPLPAASGSWSLWTNVTRVSGLDHLEGLTVSILGDGNVFPQQVVTNGAVTLNQAASKITVGLPFTAKIQTLYLDTGQPSIQGKRKKISAVSIRVDQTRGIWAGPTFDALREYKQRGLQLMGVPIPLFTGDQRLNLEPLWQTGGQICIQITDPVPATVLGVIHEIEVGDK